MTIYICKLHEFHGGAVLYRGKSLLRAIRAARKHDCTYDGNCVAGPIIIREDTEEMLGGRQAAKPFCPANELFWY